MRVTIEIETIPGVPPTRFQVECDEVNVSVPEEGVRRDGSLGPVTLTCLRPCALFNWSPQHPTSIRTVERDS